MKGRSKNNAVVFASYFFGPPRRSARDGLALKLLAAVPRSRRLAGFGLRVDVLDDFRDRRGDPVIQAR
jgi:hypothetical protein